MFGWLKKKKTGARTSGCMASHGVMRGGRAIGVMARSEPIRPEDSGWTFEGQGEDGLDDPSNWAVYQLATVVARSPDIDAHLDEPVGTVLVRDMDGELKKLRPEDAVRFLR